MEKNYDFRKKLLEVHEKGIRDFSRAVGAEEYFLPYAVTVSIDKDACEVVRTAVYDFADFLRDSMEINADICVGAENAEIKVCLASRAGVDLGEYAEYRGFMIETSADGICVYGHDARGAAQGLYYLEDVMSLEHAPAVPFGTVMKKPMFSPQMVHSGYGLDKYPDEHLVRIAHEGRDAILVFTKDVNKTPDGYLDFNDLIRRAAKYTDVFYFDYKATDEDEHRRLCGVGLDVIIKNLSALDEMGAAVTLRCPIVPDANYTEDHILGIAETARRYGCIKEIHLEPYHDLGISKSAQLGESSVFSAKAPDRDELTEKCAEISKICNKPCIIS